jgi:hypothetical protein
MIRVDPDKGIDSDAGAELVERWLQRVGGNAHRANRVNAVMAAPVRGIVAPVRERPIAAERLPHATIRRVLLA